MDAYAKTFVKISAKQFKLKYHVKTASKQDAVLVCN